MGRARRGAAQDRRGLSVAVLYPIHVLEDAEAKIAGMPIARELAGLVFDRVTIELPDPSLRGAKRS